MCGRVYADYDDYDQVDVASDCIMYDAGHGNSPGFVRAFYSAAESDDDVVDCTSSSTSPSTRGVYVVSMRTVERHGGDVRRRLPRIRVTIVSNSSEGNCLCPQRMAAKQQ